MIYEYRCEKCNENFDIVKPSSLAGKAETCPRCQEVMDRVYVFNRTPEFKAFYDEQYQQEITSARQEKKLMKQHGHIDAKEYLRPKYETAVKHARWKARKPHSVMMGG